MFNKNLVTVFALIFILIFVVCTTSTAQSLIEDGLVSYWSLDKADIEGDTVVDVFGNNDGTIKGDPETVQGRVGEALELDGDDFIDGGDPEDGSLDFGADKDFSIAAWINVSEPPADQSTIVGKGDHGGNPRILFKIDGEKIRLTIATNGRKLFSESSVVDNNWHYVCIVADRDESSQIYVDGALDAEGYVPDGDISTESSLFIGKSHQKGDTPRRFFSGIIDEVCIYNKVLSEAEINQNMNAEGLAVVSYADKLAISWGKIKISK